MYFVYMNTYIIIDLYCNRYRIDELIYVHFLWETYNLMKYNLQITYYYFYKRIQLTRVFAEPKIRVIGD